METEQRRSNRNASRGRPKDLAKRQAILEQARQLFLQQGFDAVSMEAIASAAGVAKVTLYSHFSDKEMLFAEVVHGVVENIVVPQPPSITDPADFRDRLQHFGSALVQRLSAPDLIAMDRLLSSQAAHNPKMARAFYEAGPGAVHRTLTELIEAGQASAALAVPDPAEAAEQLLSMWLGLYKLRQLLGLSEARTPAEIEQHVQRCVHTFLRAYSQSQQSEKLQQS